LFLTRPEAGTFMDLNESSNLSDLLVQRIADTPDVPAYRQFTGTEWRSWTWSEIGREVGRWRAALRRENLKPGERVAMCAHNRIEWVCFDQAALGLGLITVPLYFDDRADNMAFCLNDAGARVLMLEDGNMWAGLREQAKTIERVVCLTNAPADPKAIAVGNWLPADSEPLMRSPAKPDELATIVYTSGTTGRPKGVMLSHRNILSNVKASAACTTWSTSDRFLSFLPLSHMFERTAGYYMTIYIGAQVVYARSISLLAEDMQVQQPTVLICVPRIFERIWARMEENLPMGSPKRKLFDKASAVGWRRFADRMKARAARQGGRDGGFKREATLADHLLWPILYLLVARKLHARLGGRVRIIVSGGAALSPNLARIFIGLGLPILQGYGLTETSPVLAVNRPNDNEPFSVGRALEGIELTCTDAGELLARGPNVMLGYWNNEAATRAAIDTDGWFHTGDLVQIRDGRVYITGRVKDILVLSNGEKVSPGDVEAAIQRDTVFEQVMLVGEGRPKLGLLCVSRIEDEKDLCSRANAQLVDFPGYARIHHLARVADPWTVENGLLTPTLKVKRAKVAERHAAQIEAMYQRTDTCGGR
jgi:long-chain acyl-CoA synthetase